MAIELITGVGADNHVSSNDFRAFNRANFGQGRYILTDANNMEVVISPLTGTISISEGSCLWSGMHIRNASVENLTYIIPTTSQNVYVYLHYTKNVDTGVESVKFVVSVGNELSPVVDMLDDNTVEAYTLFCSFVASSTATSNYTEYFVKSKSQDEVINTLNGMSESKVLFEGYISQPKIINLSESMHNFRYIVFENFSRDKRFHTVMSSDCIGNDFAVSIVGNDKWGNKAALFTAIENIYATKISETEINVLYTSETVIDAGVSSRYGSDGLLLPIRIIGKERKT